MKRFDCLKAIVPLVKDKLIVTNLGGVAIEWHELADGENVFYMWHSLGLASSIGLGLSLAIPTEKVVVFDGDGGLLMNLGSLATLANCNPPNLVLIVFDNEAYEAPGGHPTATAGKADLAEIGKGAGIKASYKVTKEDDFHEIVRRAIEGNELSLIVAKIEKGTANVPHMTMDALENKYRFVRYIEKKIGINIFKPPGHVTMLRGKV